MKKVLAIVLMSFGASLSAHAMQFGCKGTTSTLTWDGVRASVVHNGKVFLDAAMAVEETLEDGSKVILTDKSEDKPDVSGARAKFRITTKEDAQSGSLVLLKVEANEGLTSLFQWYPVLSCSGSDILIDNQ